MAEILHHLYIKLGNYIYIYMGVSKNRETPQNGWFMMENPIKMEDLGGTIFFGKLPTSTG